MTSEGNQEIKDTDLFTDVVTEAVEAAPDQEIDPVAALTADLQRLQAEYANYRKRVERDRTLAHELAVSAVLTELLPALDDIDRAAEHGELTGGFKAVADQIATTTTRIGLEKYGAAGDAFDPQRCSMTPQRRSPSLPRQRFCNQVINLKSASCAQHVLR
jgi:molecular chaperone GrpE